MYVPFTELQTTDNTAEFKIGDQCLVYDVNQHAEKRFCKRSTQSTSVFQECVIERRLPAGRPMFHIQCEMNNNAHKKAKYGGKEFLSDHMQESHLLAGKKSIRYAVLLGF